ncbi:MAG: ABC transporter ATP-binding protein [Spirochaetales bacterium]|nr:ABC transporter ATP-binding protein [Spirochaetales bacterium]
MPKIELKNITKKFGGTFTAVDNLSITIEDGDFITLLGPSGCGKTTTLRQIAGLETPTEGEIIIDGKKVFSSTDMIDVSPSKRDVGFLFQNYALWPHMTVYRNIAFGLENLKWEKDKIDKRVKELLALLKIEEFAERYPAELSGGQQQRVAIARTLATNPRVLLMDEPLSNLDAKLRMEMRTELKRLHRETGATFVYVTHDQLEAMTLATKICLLDKGVLQQYAPPLTVYNKPANTFVADFVGSPTINFLKCSNEGGGVFSSPIGRIKFNRVDGGLSDVGANSTIGIRPEFVTMDKNGKLEGEVLSSLPSGMETTLRLKVKDFVFSSVLFGSLDFKVGEKIPLSLSGESFVLFDSNGDYAGEGSLEIM